MDPVFWSYVLILTVTPIVLCVIVWTLAHRR
jgi:hypothetical protein